MRGAGADAGEVETVSKDAGLFKETLMTKPKEKEEARCLRVFGVEGFIGCRKKEDGGLGCDNNDNVVNAREGKESRWPWKEVRDLAIDTGGRLMVNIEI